MPSSKKTARRSLREFLTPKLYPHLECRYCLRLWYFPVGSLRVLAELSHWIGTCRTGQPHYPIRYTRLVGGEGWADFPTLEREKTRSCFQPSFSGQILTPQAVEVARFSLLLKIASIRWKLVSINSQVPWIKTALPSLIANIKAGQQLRLTAAISEFDNRKSLSSPIIWAFIPLSGRKNSPAIFQEGGSILLLAIRPISASEHGAFLTQRSWAYYQSQNSVYLILCVESCQKKKKKKIKIHT